MSQRKAQVRSYREVFRLRDGRRIHTVFGHEVPWPDGLPALPAVHAAVVFVLMLVAPGLPGGGLLGGVPYQLRFIALPIAAFVFASVRTPDGRSLYRYAGDVAAAALGLQGARSRRFRRIVASGGELYMRPDLGWPELERGTLQLLDGGGVRFHRPVRVHRGRRRVCVRGGGESQLVELAPGQTLTVRP